MDLVRRFPCHFSFNDISAGKDKGEYETNIGYRRHIGNATNRYQSCNYSVPTQARGFFNLRCNFIVDEGKELPA